VVDHSKPKALSSNPIPLKNKFTPYFLLIISRIDCFLKLSKEVSFFLNHIIVVLRYIVTFIDHMYHS
jgi:hypothetical protein